MKRHGSDSQAQRDAQSQMLERFGKTIQKDLQPNHKVSLDGASVNVDGYFESQQEIVLVECWAHMNKAKPAQRHKIAADILKLSFVSASLRKKWPDKVVKCYIVFVDKDAAEVVNGASWIAAAAKDYEVSASVITLDSEMTGNIKRAQEVQNLLKQP